jgi:hypothetical protein
MDDLIDQLRAKRIIGHVSSATTQNYPEMIPDPVCVAAADRIEALQDAIRLINEGLERARPRCTRGGKRDE